MPSASEDDRSDLNDKQGAKRTPPGRLLLEPRSGEVLAQPVGPSPDIRLHPRLGEVYAEKVAGVEVALNDPAIRTEAAGILRQVIDRVELRPSADGKTLDAILHGDLATILMFARRLGATKKPRSWVLRG